MSDPQPPATLEAMARRISKMEEACATLAAENAALRESQEKLRLSEEHYRFTVELSEQLAWTADPDGKLLYVSSGIHTLVGISRTNPEESWLSVIHPDDIPTVQNAWRKAVATGEFRTCEFRMRLRDGSYHLFCARAAPRLNEAGQVVRWYGFTRDIQQQRELEIAQRAAEERLRESEELYRYALELSQQMVWTADPRGHMLTMSPRFSQLTGMPVEAPPEDVVHPEDLEHLLETWSESVRLGRKHLVDFRMRVADGSYRMFRSRAAPRRDQDGTIIRWYGTAEDVQDQLQANAARLEAEERYRLAARATNDFIWDLRVDAGHVYWSGAANDYFGFAEQEQRTPLSWWEERLHPADRNRVSTSFNKALAKRRSHWTATYRFRKANGEYAEVVDRCFIIRDAGGAAVRAVGAMADVTERRRAAKELRRIQAELVHVSRMSAMGTMGSILAHELNQPLTAVASYLRGSLRLLACTDDPVADEVAVALQAAETSALRAGQIVRHLRELVARGNLTVKRENLPKLVEEASGLGLSEEQASHIHHVIDIDEGSEWVDVDRIQIQQVLINLIRNAAQSMSGAASGEIRIEAGVSSAHWVELSVADRGSGISPEIRESLFAPFHSTRAGGMGIGLSISRTIVEAHGGKIWAEDREGGGTIFRFTIPVSQTSEP